MSTQKDPILWIPKPENTRVIDRFIQSYRPQAKNYQELHTWSVNHLSEFWTAVLDFSKLIYEGQAKAVVSDENLMWPRPEWFKGVQLNFTENVFRHPEDALAIKYKTQLGTKNLTYQQLYNRVAQLSEWFTQQGLKAGDCVAGFIPNCPEAIEAFLAVAACGGVWTSCSPEAGTQFALDRFSQTQPAFLVSVQGYTYDKKWFDLMPKIQELSAQLPTLKNTLIIERTTPIAFRSSPTMTGYSSIVSEKLPVPILKYSRVSFSAPLFYLFSSGTTGKPKAIVHSLGGTLLQHVKEHQLQSNMEPGDNLFYYTTTSWMMWNWMVSALASGVSLTLYDEKPDPLTLWNLVKDENVTSFGTSAPWISLSQKSKLVFKPNNFPHLKHIFSTGAPLLREQFDYIYTSVSSHVQLISISGGTDIISCFAGGGPVPVQRGHLQCAGLGMSLDSYDENGKPIRNKEGELVCTKPFPCMPIYFLNDPEGALYKAAYFEAFEGIWAHGDYAVLYDDLSVEIIGRSDSTLKRHGVRIGTADIYNAIQNHPALDDALAIGKKKQDNEDLLLFVKLKPQVEPSPSLKKEFRQLLVAQSPWFKPDGIYFVTDIPYTTNGKKSEVLVKNLLNGKPITNKGVLRNPECLVQFEELLETL